MTSPRIQTVAAVNYLPSVLVLAESLKRCMPDARLCTLLTDATPAMRDRIRREFQSESEFVCCDDLDVGTISRMREYYSLFEFNSACKALALDHQLRTRGETECFFLDPDMLALDDFTEPARRLGCDFVVTPHTLAPYPDDGELPIDAELATSGFVNGGFIYVRNTPRGREALEWLVKQTRFNWFVAPLFGLYGDQHWLSLMLHFFDGATGLLSDPGVNIAYWNLHERPLREYEGEILTGDPPNRARLFHFSGFRTPSGGRLTRHSSRRFDAETEQLLVRVVGSYEQALSEQTSRVTRCGFSGDLGFSARPLLARMKSAERLWHTRFVQPSPLPGTFARLGHKLDRLISGLGRAGVAGG